MSYRTPVQGTAAELKEKGSRFLAVVDPAATAGEARRRIEEIAAAHRDATHVCWAYRVGAPASEGRSDAGEPPGTAGMPMLQVLRGAELSDVVAVVVRWFGGTKLGKGGLARAYAGAVKLALESLTVSERVPTRRLRIEVSYSDLGAIQRRIHPPEITLSAADYGGDRARLELEVQEGQAEKLLETLAALGCDPATLD